MKRTSLSMGLSVGMWALFAAMPPQPRADTPEAADAEARCRALQAGEFAQILDAPTHVTSSVVVADTDQLPSFCRVQGYVTPNTGIELRLPISNWNGKFFQAGCTGSCGFAADSFWTAECDYPLTKGYACIISDMGHRSGASDGLWAYRNLEARVDFGYRATHRTALAGKALTEQFYGSPPRRSYFMGCSTGGRQGLVLAQRFPWTFDGIIAGAPVVSEGGTSMNFIWNLAALSDPAGRPLFRPADLQLLHEAVIAAADMNDGVADGVIGDPRLSRFDPASLRCGTPSPERCFTAEQVEAARKVYGGPVTSRGEPTYFGGGPQHGSELNWRSFLPREDGGPAPGQRSGVDTTRYIMSDWGPEWEYRDFDFDRDYQRMTELELLYSASHPDLRAFRAAGGKLMIYQGWSDAIVTPLNSVDYYEITERAMGGEEATQAFFRLFMVPGMGHCFGGGPFAIDYISAMEAWVERGEAPAALIGAHLAGSHSGPSMIRMFPRDPVTVVYTRPVFPYPNLARYRGHVDPNEAASFESYRPGPPD